MYAAVIKEAELPREMTQDLMRRAKENMGGEGDLMLTRAKEGVYRALFDNEEHRAAFVVSLQRRGVGYVLEEIPSSKVRVSEAKSSPNPQAPSTAEVFIVIVDFLAAQLRKKK